MGRPSSSQSVERKIEEPTGKVRAVVRIRPMSDMEESNPNSYRVVQVNSDQKTIQINADGKITGIAFDKVYDENISQTTFFDDCGVKGLILQAIKGFSATIFAYGQTGSGKTFTITGPQDGDHDDTGLVQRSLSFLYSHISKSMTKPRIQASYCEIYNEQILDLLNPAESNLPVRWTADRGFFVENLYIVDCDVLGDCLGVLDEGLRNRTVAASKMNEHSSRSHSILTLYFETTMMDTEENRGVKRHGKISFVDLAGGEKGMQNSGDLFNESLSINKSLLTLGICISALSDPRKKVGGHVPFRDSKLTKLLSDSLGGTGYALMVACISPSSLNLTETFKTLRYTSKARCIENKPTLQLDPKEEAVLILKRENQALKKEIMVLRGLLDGDPRYANMLPDIQKRDSVNAEELNASLTAVMRQPTRHQTPFSSMTHPMKEMDRLPPMPKTPKKPSPPLDRRAKAKSRGKEMDPKIASLKRSSAPAGAERSNDPLPYGYKRSNPPPPIDTSSSVRNSTTSIQKPSPEPEASKSWWGRKKERPTKEPPPVIEKDVFTPDKELDRKKLKKDVDDLEKEIQKMKAQKK